MALASIQAALVSIKAAMEIAKLIKDSDISLEKAESKLKFADIISALADAKVQIAEVQQFLIDKDEELRALKGQLEIKEKLSWEKPCYWLIDGDKKEGPYCQKCYDKDHLLIRLQNREKGYWECMECKNSYYGDDFDICGAFAMND